MTQAFYGLKTLNANWYEDRLQPEGGTMAPAADTKVLRPHESEIANVSDRYDVLSRIARATPRKSYAMPDDGFRERGTLHNLDYAHPRSRKEVVRNPPESPKFITTETVPEVCYEDRRPIEGNRRGFGAVLNRHEESHEQRFWSTTHGDTYGECNRTPRARLEASGLRPAGVSNLEQTHKVTGCKVGKLCGEDYREGMDPAADTVIQRSWLYAQDASLRHIDYGGKKAPLPADDNMLSLPLGEMLRKGKDGKRIQDDVERRGMLFRVATEITKGRGERPGVAVFQDDFQGE